MARSNMSNAAAGRESNSQGRSILGFLWHEPGYDSRDWLLPKLSCVLYRIGMVLTIVLTVGFSVVSLVNFGIYLNNILFAFVYAFIVIPLVGLLALLLQRISYELTILLFRIFESNRDSLSELKRLNSETHK